MDIVKRAEEKSLSMDTFRIQIGYLEGKILTIADATFGDKEQREAHKSLVRRMFREQRNHVDNIVYGYDASSDGSVKADPVHDN